jgi:diaminopimelate epimerase
MKKVFNYYLYDMCGNKTALVEASNVNKDLRKIINDEIMNKNCDIEQVGFVSKEEFKLTMAGGEFCGNATRGTAYYYLNGKKGEISIKVSNDITLRAGVTEDGKAWTEMPLYKGEEQIRKLDNGIYEVIMDGINFIILEENVSKEYLEDKSDLKEKTKEILSKYDVSESEATGVIFEELDVNNRIKINPVVWVKSIDTLFYENACGSGTTAVAMLESIKCKESKKIEIVQPSKEVIIANVYFDNDKIKKASICGGLNIDKEVRSIDIEI